MKLHLYSYDSVTNYSCQQNRLLDSLKCLNLGWVINKNIIIRLGSMMWGKIFTLKKLLKKLPIIKVEITLYILKNIIINVSDNNINI